LTDGKALGERSDISFRGGVGAGIRFAWWYGGVERSGLFSHPPFGYFLIEPAVSPRLLRGLYRRSRRAPYRGGLSRAGESYDRLKAPRDSNHAGYEYEKDRNGAGNAVRIASLADDPVWGEPLSGILAILAGKRGFFSMIIERRFQFVPGLRGLANATMKIANRNGGQLMNVVITLSASN
jgi:hypothetical protein